MYERFESARELRYESYVKSKKRNGFVLVFKEGNEAVVLSGR